MPSDTDAKRQFEVAINCKCGQTGVALWEENAASNKDKPEPILISLSDAFYERIKNSHTFRIELVCNYCGVVQQD